VENGASAAFYVTTGITIILILLSSLLLHCKCHDYGDGDDAVTLSVIHDKHTVNLAQNARIMRGKVGQVKWNNYRS
jgi:hypothetical protein